MSTGTGQGQAFNAGIVTMEATHHWECPMCGRQHVTHRQDAHTPLHQCPKLAGAWAPFVAAGIKANLRVNERQDYVGTDTPFVDSNGRIIQSITTEREDGEDCHIFVPTINARLWAD